MTIHRRVLLAAVPALVAGAAFAEETTPTLETYERAVGGRIGLFAENLKTGAKIAWRADERFPMCSTFKASLAACVLVRVDRGEDDLDRIVTYGQGDLQEYAPLAEDNLAKGGLSVAELCRGAVELSDNTCANLLLARIGGPAALTAFWRSIGDADTRLDHFEPELNRSRPPDIRDTTTPAAMAGSLRRCVLGEVLSPRSRERLTRWMLDCKTGIDLLRAGLPKGWSVADKTGNSGKDVLGDIAVARADPARPLVIAVYTEGGSATPPQLRRLLANLGKLIGRQFS
ncbi:MAG TPA: class A beta-lactamase [Stellaceae bacterium]|jgi:beta-lactamase class A|nr:class A beta-lactamase [Stellaceae bacterium]